jgi:hypothetical protein
MLEGRLSVISRIAAVYLTVSKQFIIPGIDLMEQLSVLTDEEYRVKQEEFYQFCKNGEQSINRLASEARSTLVNLMPNPS